MRVIEIKLDEIVNDDNRALYLQTAKEAAAAALEKKKGKKENAPGAKRGEKKKTVDDDPGDAGAEDDEDDYPFSPDEDTYTEADVYAEDDPS